MITAILFGLGLLELHWREKDEMEAEAKAKAGPDGGAAPGTTPN